MPFTLYFRIALGVALALSLVPARAADTLTVRSTADSGPGSLREALDAARASAFITFDTSLSGQRIALSSGPLRLRVGLTIGGANLSEPLTLDGQGQQRILQIFAESSCTVAGLRIENGQAQSGGAILVELGDGHRLIDCHFSRNAATDVGGAIHFDGGHSGRVEGCTFERNTARDGGALYGLGGELEVLASAFIENEVSGTGGAIYCYGSGHRMARCTFTANAANQSGALWFDSEAAFNTVDSCAFSRNVATESAGAASGGSYTACTFTENNCQNGDGGALEAVSRVRACTFTGNRANERGGEPHGGAIYEAVEVIDSHFERNDAFQGGALANVPFIQGCTFRGNSSLGGGAVYASGTLTRCRFVDNRTAGQFSAGGAVAEVQNVDSCYFERNVGGSSGGAVYKAGSVSGCRFVENRSDRDGGAVAEAQVLLNCTFEVNGALGNGGAVAGGRVIGCYFTHNQSSRAGGAVFEPVALFQSTLEDNTAGGGGGAACWANTALFNNLIANNRGSVGPADVSGDIRSLGGNLVGNGRGSAGWTATDRVGSAAQPVDMRWADFACDSLTLRGPGPDSPALGLGRDTSLAWICADLCGTLRRSTCLDAGAVVASDCPSSPPAGRGLCGPTDRGGSQPSVAVRVCPNPTSGPIALDAHWTQGGDLHVAVVDAAGRVVIERREAAPAGTWRSHLDLEGLPAGVYAVVLRGPQGLQAVRVVRD